MPSSTVEQLYAFHAKDREIFSKLVLTFSRLPSESLLVMATWFWLEDFWYGNIMSIVYALPDPVVEALVDEAVSCFQCVDSNEPPYSFNKIPLTAKLLKKDISLLSIYKHRYTAIAGIKNFLTTICSRVFSDILQQVVPYSSPCFVNKFLHPLIIPGFPHPTFGSINVMPDFDVGDNIISSNNLFIFPSGIWRWNASSIATENDRTMFITFSRGFPVSHAEVKELFTKIFGENCVVGIYMPENNNTSSPNTDESCNGQQQKLFARLVLDSVTTVDRILEGQKINKFKINGKHIWAPDEERPPLEDDVDFEGSKMEEVD
ncbi:unnamed protein product [Microthlaspi erraticum]|uniref:RRM domain-containing protein n=1 Tax=Microthlaspi erraticum TaxID=1685480 RepID=A0A6D2JSU8_9BRAS|nr:unnamed protein product [Microthlaspi erraticum]